MKISPKRLVLILLAVAAAVYAGLALRPKPLLVETAAVVKGALRESIEEDGEARIRHRHGVATPVAGRLERIALRPGDAVVAGETLARLDPLPLDPRTRDQTQARLAAAEASRRAAEALVRREREALEQARRTLERMERLVTQQVIAADERDAARTSARSAESDFEAARYRARSAAFDVATLRTALVEGGSSNVVLIRAPIAGRVLRVFEDSEKVVAAGTPLVELGDPADLEIRVDVLTSDAMRVRAGAPIWLDAGAGDRRLRARVRGVEPSAFTKVSPLGVEEQRVNVIGDLVDPPGALGDRFRVEAEIVVWQGTDVLKIPAGALFRAGRDWAVFTVSNGRAGRRPIKLGHRNPDEAEILSGLKEGETVIVHPSDAVEDGVKVSAQVGTIR